MTMMMTAFTQEVSISARNTSWNHPESRGTNSGVSLGTSQGSGAPGQPPHPTVKEEVELVT